MSTKTLSARISLELDKRFTHLAVALGVKKVDLLVEAIEDVIFKYYDTEDGKYWSKEREEKK